MSTITLISAEGTQFTVRKEPICRSVLIRNIIDDLDDSHECTFFTLTLAIPLPNVNAPILRKIIEFCEHYENEPMGSDSEDDPRLRTTTDISEWDQRS